MSEDIADWLEYHIKIAEEKLISEFVNRIEKHRLQMEKQEGYWAIEFFEDVMNYKRELEERLK